MESEIMAVVTFTTDYGRADGYAGAMKGVVLSLAPDAVLVDISHDIPARDVASGAFTLAQASRFFPPGTIHVAVVDPGVGGDRAAVVVASGGSYFVGPDNGLLDLAAPAPRRAWRIENPQFRHEPVSATFHGRDLFAPAAGRLASGWAADRAGPPVPELVPAPFGPGAPLTEDAEGEVIHVDTFGNLLTSLSASDEVRGRWRLDIGGGRFELPGARTFADVPEGSPLIYRGSAGQVEVAVRDGSAADLTGAARGSRLRLTRLSS
jgi:S-adenosylmethionine hydrolase